MFKSNVLNKTPFFESFFEKKEFLQKKSDFVKEISFGLKEFEQLLWYTNKIDSSKIQIRSNSIETTVVGKQDILGLAINSIKIGRSIAINYAENFDPYLGKLVRHVGEFFGSTAHCSVIFTPKNSNLFQEPIDDIPNIALNRKYKLKKNDLFYIPRGVIHKVSTADSHSLHLSIGLGLNRNIDVIKEYLSDLSLDEIELRRTATRSSINSLKIKQFQNIINELMVPIQIEKSIETINCSKFSQLELLPDNKISNNINTTKIDGESNVKKYLGMPSQHTIRENKIFFSFPMKLGDSDSWKNYSLVCPQIILPTIMFIQKSNSSFKVKNLPGHLSEVSKIELVQRLIELHFLEIVE